MIKVRVPLELEKARCIYPDCIIIQCHVRIVRLVYVYTMCTFALYILESHYKTKLYHIVLDGYSYILL